MDKILLSPKFEQLKLNIGAKRTEKFKRPKPLEKRLKNSSQFLIQNRKCAPTIRESPRRRQNVKEFNVKDLQCSFRSNDTSGKRSQIESQKSSFQNLEENNSQKRSEKSQSKSNVVPPVNSNVSRTLKALRNINSIQNVNNTNVTHSDKYERDSSGFLKPLQPVLKRNYVEEETKRFADRYKKLFDSNLFDEIETVYQLEKLINYSHRETVKLLRKEQSLPDVPLSENLQFPDRISAWIQSCQFKDPSMMTGNSNTRTSCRENLTNPTTSSIDGSTNENFRKDAFILKDWSVIKGTGETELMVSGTLIEMRSRKVIEMNHTSSSIQNVTANNCVNTVCCVYKLCDKFVGRDDMPLEIKKFFMNGKFPDGWKKITSNWHSMNQKKTLSSTTARRTLQYGIKEDANPAGRF